MKAIVTDIEGTTSSIAFVKQTLFPYSRLHLPAFVTVTAGRPEVAALLDEARRLAGDPGLDLAGTIATLVGWIDADRKVPPLKALQGMIWRRGYQRGEYRGHVYPDAVRALHRWSASGIPVYVYSSGSVEAQRLLFAHSTAGDLTHCFAGYFDTAVGAKQDPASYRAIAAAVGIAPPEITFLSDAQAELEAAAQTGFQAVRLCREGPAPATSPWPSVSTFDELPF